MKKNYFILINQKITQILILFYHLMNLFFGLNMNFLIHKWTMNAPIPIHKSTIVILKTFKKQIYYQSTMKTFYMIYIN